MHVNWLVSYQHFKDYLLCLHPYFLSLPAEEKWAEQNEGQRLEGTGGGEKEVLMSKKRRYWKAEKKMGGDKEVEGAWPTEMQRVGLCTGQQLPHFNDQSSKLSDIPGTQGGTLTVLAVRAWKTGSLFHSIPAMCDECGRARGMGIVLSGGNLPLMGGWYRNDICDPSLPLLGLIINFLLPLVTAVKILQIWWMIDERVPTSLAKGCWAVCAHNRCPINLSVNEWVSCGPSLGEMLSNLLVSWES